MHSFLLAHPRATTDAELERLRAAVTEALTQASAGQPFTVTLARDEWQQNFERCGGWSDWIADVVNGTDFASGQPRYTGFVASSHIIGKATAEMLHLALYAKKPVAVFDGGALVPASRVVQVEAHDFKAGWWVE